LRASGERPCGCRATDKSNKFAPSHKVSRLGIRLTETNIAARRGLRVDVADGSPAVFG
jgi:hypothetical protein